MIHGLAGKQISTQGGLSVEIGEIPLIFLSKLLSFKKSYLNKFKPQLTKSEIFEIVCFCFYVHGLQCPYSAPQSVKRFILFGSIQRNTH